jgi:putative inorganic carbon (hco3(-)) transporter
MRDIAVLVIVLGSVPVCLFSPYYGILVWSWLAYFNPHRFAYGVAYNFPVAQVIAVPTLIGTLFTNERNRNIFTRETVLIITLACWFGVTYAYSTTIPELAYNEIMFVTPLSELITISKVILMTLVSILLINSKDKLRYLFILTAFSFGILAIKGALFGLRTGGEQRVWGPPGSFVEDNNFLALATNMCLPMFYYMARYEENRRLRLLMRITFVCAIFSVLLSYSRGGLLGLAVVLTAIAVRSRYKTLSITLLITAGLLVVSFAPERWVDRMGSFVHGNLDNSAERRLNAWHYAFVLAKNYPLTGGSFNAFTPRLFEKYAPGLEYAGPHSVYFQMMGEHGFVGFGIFVTLLGSCWFSLRRLERIARSVPELEWMMPYSQMLRVSLLGFMISGAFLACAYFDLFYQLCAATIILKILSRKQLLLLASKSKDEAVADSQEQEATQWAPDAALVNFGQGVV